MSAPPMSPYKGLVPYAEEDAPFFFGREAEREIILANLMASRLTLLYGASGVGKSSVLRAGVAHHVRASAAREIAEWGRPEFLVMVFNSWKDDPVAGLLECVRVSAAHLPGGAQPPAEADSGSLADTLYAWTEHLRCDFLIVLDQFEEFFLYHGQEDGAGTFAREFPEAVNRRDLRASFLISIREDALAKLDRFKGRIPNLFDNYLRIEFLTVEAARSAILKPVEHYNRTCVAEPERVTVETELVDAVLNEIRTGRLALGEAGRGGIAPAPESPADNARVETPFLQLVMTRLWEKDAGTGSRVLRRASLEELGGAKQIVRTHLDTVMKSLPRADQDAAARIFHFLVTPSGTKIAHAPSDLSDYTGLPAAEIARVLEKLSTSETRILRSDAPRYEIFHDVLAPAILDWRRRYGERQQQAEIERQARRRILLLRLVLAGMFAVTGVALYAGFDSWQRKDEALGQLNEESDLKQDLLARIEASQQVVHDPEVSAAEVASVFEQADYAPDDRARRAGVTVRYFQAEIVEPSGVLDSLQALGFRVVRSKGRFDAAPNSLAYGSGVRLEDVKLLAVVMLHSGFPMKRIRLFQNEGERSNVIEVVHTPALVQWPPLSIDEIRGLSEEILRSKTRYSSAAPEG